MSLRPPPRPVNMTLNLAPLVDVMMCLIVFFLLASKMVAAELNPVNLAWAVASRPVEPGDLGDRVTITVRHGASDDLAEYVVTEWDGQAIVERKLSPGEIETLLTTRSAAAKHRERELRCVVRADRMIRYQHVETVLRSCGKAKVRNVVFSVNEGAPPES